MQRRDALAVNEKAWKGAEVTISEADDGSPLW